MLNRSSRKLVMLCVISFNCISSSIFAQQWTTSGANIHNANTGNVGIGTTTPTNKLELVGSGTGFPTPFLIRNANNPNELAMYVNSATDLHHNSITFFRSRGTYAAPTVVSANDRAGAICGAPYINGAFRPSSTIEFFVGSTVGINSYPMNIRFFTTGNNETTRSERMRISENGFVGIGKTAPAYALDVNGTVNASAILINGGPISTSQWATVGSNINFTTGMVSIGTATTPAGYKLAVGGKMVTEEVVVKLQANWPDYVFANDYKLPSLSELERYIQENKHLPDVPNAAEVAKDGIRVGEMEMILLKKIEELTLHVIELEKKLNEKIKE